MKTTKKILCAALAGAMAVGAALPAFAEQAALEKDESVYVVMNADGSVQSQTVSEHLHSEGGLRSVKDQSSLSDIQNTQGDAAFTQNGTELCWQTDDTDVYYKGFSGQVPPVTASISYSLDGKTAAADALAGQSGHLVITIALTNHETGTATVNGAQRAVCTPFVTAVGTVLGDSFTNVTALHGTVQGDGASQIAGFVCLPGVKGCLNDLLPSELDTLKDYLLDTVTIEADVTDFAAPSIMVACATDTSILQDSDSFGKLGDLGDLSDDLDKLTDAMNQLLDGADQLNSGAAQLYTGAGKLDSGAADLKTGTGTLYSGTQTLSDGASQLNSGAQELKTGIDSANSGAQKLKSGASELNTGLKTISGGLNTLADKNDTLNNGMAQVAAAVLASVNTQLIQQGVLSVGGELKWENGDYSTRLTALINNGSDQMNQGVEQNLRTQVDAATDQQGVARLTDAQFNTLLYLVNSALAPGQTYDQAALQTAVGDVLLNKMQPAAAASAPNGVITNAQTQIAASSAETIVAGTILATLRAQLGTAGVTDESTQNLVLAMAVLDSGHDITAAANRAGAIAAASNAGAITDPTQIIANLVAANAADQATAAAWLQNYSDAQTALVAAGANGVLAVPGAETLFCEMAQQKTGKDTQTNALLFLIAQELMQQDAALSQTAAIAQAGEILTNAATVQAAQTAANPADGSTAPEITNLLTLAAHSAMQTPLTQALASLNGVNELVKGLQDYTGAVTQLAAGATQATSGSTDLLSGLGTLAEGTAKLAEGASTLVSGTDTLTTGAADLNAGAQTLDSGAADLKKGTGDLKSGAASLKDGTGDLKDGVDRLNSEGISKLTDAIDPDQLATLKGMLEVMRDRQQQYTSYTGAPEGAEVQVRFVMKTTESVKTISETAESAQPATAKLSFWQRVLALFGIKTA